MVSDHTGLVPTVIPPLTSPGTPPRLEANPVDRVFHRDTVQDPYEYVRALDEAETTRVLEAETAYANTYLDRLSPIADELVGEMEGRFPEVLVEAPVTYGVWAYITRRPANQDYPIISRRRISIVDPITAEQGPHEQLILDVNELAKEHTFTHLGAFLPAPDGVHIAYLVDHSGDEHFDLVIMSIPDPQSSPVSAKIEIVDANVTGLTYGLAWGAQSQSIMYITPDDAWRAEKVWTHVVGDDQNRDLMIYREEDERFSLGIHGSLCERMVVVGAYATDTTEMWLIDTRTPVARPKLIPTLGRKEGVEYDVSPSLNHLVVRTNAEHPNFAVQTEPYPLVMGIGPKDHPGQLIYQEDSHFIEEVHIGRDFGAITLRRDGRTDVQILVRNDSHAPMLAVEANNLTDYAPTAGPVHECGTHGSACWNLQGESLGTRFGDILTEATTVSLAQGQRWDSPHVSLLTESLVHQPTLYDYTYREQTIAETWRQAIPNFDAANYVQWREWVTAEDGTQVPLIMAGHRQVLEQTDNPVILYGYGSYGISSDPAFSLLRMSLLDRGVIYAIAQVRGGTEMGRHWYEDGRRMNKRNTFTDFVAAARYLQEHELVDPSKIAARGGSAGGLLMGAVTNLAPDAFACVWADVPFVDSLTTILKPELPLTIGEWSEWGNPMTDAKVYEYMRSYSPYENIAEGVTYPPILATTGRNDVRVSYVEPLKWVQRLRALGVTGDTHPAIMHVEMVAGHGGVTGRTAAWRQDALFYAFMLSYLM